MPAHLLLALALAAPTPARIPLVDGLTIVHAVAEPTGDYESMKRVSEVGPRGYRITLTTDKPSTPAGGAEGLGGALKDWGFKPIQGKTSKPAGTDKKEQVTMVRKVRAQDQQGAAAWRPEYSNRDPQEFPGQTALGPSRAVFEALRGKGEAELRLLATPGGDLAANLMRAMTGTAELTGKVRRVKQVDFSTLVNGVRTALPALQLKGTLKDAKGAQHVFEATLLDDPANPLALSLALDEKTHGEVIRIDFPLPPKIEEEALQACQAVELHGIYFAFASADLRPESKPALDAVAKLLARHADWKVRLEGHTDSVGDAASNQALSERRAAAVKAALAARPGGSAARIDTAGFGKSRPRESNDTPAGRARNRRVELLRVCG